jgi:3-phenylpropionate/trans-cinnamate dioxygenase ferredoxin reductase subunit
MQTFVIVGSGVAGGTAALRLRAEGFEGRVIVIGDEPGPPCSRPSLSKQVLRGEASPARADLRPAGWFEAQSIELLPEETAATIDVGGHRVTLAGGTSLRYDKLLLATGGRARLFPGAPEGAVHCLRTVADSVGIARELRPGRSVIVLGAGFIGAEVAASARSLGCEVTIVEAAPQPMQRVLPEPIGTRFAELHRAHGVTVLTGSAVANVVSRGDETVVRTVDDRTLSAELVIAGLGMVPNVELAEDAGIGVANGILVDEQCRTSAPDVFAAGDVANHPNPLLGRRIRVEHWQNAQHQAAVAGKNMLGSSEAFAEIPWMWTDQYDVNVQIAGDPLPTDDLLEIVPFTTGDGLALLTRAGVVTSIVALNRGEVIRRLRRRLAEGPLLAGSVLAHGKDRLGALDELMAVPPADVG